MMPSNIRLVPKLKIQSLQVFRGLAALAVVTQLGRVIYRTALAKYSQSTIGLLGL